MLGSARAVFGPVAEVAAGEAVVARVGEVVGDGVEVLAEPEVEATDVVVPEVVGVWVVDEVLGEWCGC